MRREGQALTESIVLHGLLAGLFFLVVRATAPPPKPIQFDFSLLKNIDTPLHQNLSAQKAPAVSQPEQVPASVPKELTKPKPEPITKPQPTVTAHISPEKVKQIKPKNKSKSVEPHALQPEHRRAVSKSAEVVSALQNLARTKPTSQKQADVLSRQGVDSDQKVPGVHSYLSLIRKRIEQHKKYPLRAKLHRLEGKVLIRFVLNPDGQVSSLDIRGSSGHDCLDKAAIEAVRLASPMPPSPGGTLSSAISMELTIVFKLT